MDKDGQPAGSSDSLHSSIAHSVAPPTPGTPDPSSALKNDLESVKNQILWKTARQMAVGPPRKKSRLAQEAESSTLQELLSDIQKEKEKLVKDLDNLEDQLIRDCKQNILSKSSAEITNNDIQLISTMNDVLQYRNDYKRKVFELDRKAEVLRRVIDNAGNFILDVTSNSKTRRVVFDEASMGESKFKLFSLEPESMEQTPPQSHVDLTEKPSNTEDSPESAPPSSENHSTDKTN